ncbi:PAS domain-containing sensor histidine kinase [Nisaea sediminum]|uniref:PAS domain-containing sensor histidine kinase n=1 Tax=Nisaea sediminum TaxID=2775867 RepID=UPI001867E615|nr:PAS domain-containing sensor histidine kinase [Nisaea sediminum]
MRYRPEIEDYFFEWRCDHRGALTHLSGNFRALTGLDPSKLIGRAPPGMIEAMRSAAGRNLPFRGLHVTFSDGGATRTILLNGGLADPARSGVGEFHGYGFCPDKAESETDEDEVDLSGCGIDRSTILDRAQKLGKIGYSIMEQRTGDVVFHGPMREILGIPDGRISLEEIRARLLPEDVAVYDAARQEAFETGRPVLAELRYGRDRTDCKHVRLQFEPVISSDGSVGSLFTVHQDITEHRSAEKALVRAQELGRMGHWRRYETGEEPYWSDTLLEIFGVKELRDRGELPQRFASRLIHPDDRPDYIALRDAAARAGQDYEAVVRVTRPDGKMVWVEIRGHPIVDSEGNLFGTLGTVQDVTTFKQLEQEILQRDQWFKRAQRLGGLGHWAFDPEERRIYFSEQSQITFGCPGSEYLTFREAIDRIHPDDHVVFERMREKVAKGEPGFEFELRVIRKGGSMAHLRISAEFDFADDGRLKRTFGVMSDVTRLVEAEAARRDAEAVMTDIFENADSGILVRDLSGRFIRVNTRAAIQLGLRMDDILGHTVDEVLAQSDRMESAKQLNDAALRVTATRGSVTYDYSFVPKAGGPSTQIRVVNFAISGRDGAILAIASMRYDITEFVQAQTALKGLNESLEQTIRTRTKELRESEERFRNIASASADWLWELDADLKMVWCSENFFEITERKAEEYLGKPLLSLVSDQERFVDQREAWDSFEEKVGSRSPVRGLEIERQYPSGNRTIRINAKPIWIDGVFAGYQGSTTDITELKQAQNRLIETERLASLGGLVAGISHEINTPVGASYTVVTKLTRSLLELSTAYETRSISQSLFARVMTELQEGLGIIQRGLERTSELISHFKQVAVDQTSHKRRSFELADLTRDIVATMEATISGRDIAIVASVPEGIELDSYPGPLGQVMINLIQNSVLHAFDQDVGISSRIDVTASLEDAGSLSLTVSDNGKGMSAKVVRRVFEPFFTTRFGSGGSGLGMHLVYSIVHTVLGGDVSVSSEPGKGTKVVISIPLVAPEVSEQETQADA